MARMNPTTNSTTSNKKSNILRKHVEEFIAYYFSLGKSEVTLAGYKRVLDKMADFITENYEIKGVEDVKGYMLVAYQTKMGHIKAQSKNYYIIVLKQFFKFLVQAGYIEKNPSLVLKNAKVIHDDPESERDVDDGAYAPKQLLSLMKAVKGRYEARDRAIIALLSGSGLRASELCSMDVGTWRNQQNGHIRVKRKGGAWRWVAVAKYVGSYMERYLLTLDDQSDDAPLFVTSRAVRMNRVSLYRILKKHQVEANVPVGVHIFRHTFLTGTSKASNIGVAKVLADHGDIKTTRGYISTTTEERMDAVNGTSWAEEMKGLSKS